MILDIRNSNILFDWISYILKAKDLEIEINKTINNSGKSKVIKINDKEWQIEKVGQNQFTLRSQDGYILEFKSGELLFEDSIKPYIENTIKHELFKIKNDQIAIIKNPVLGKYLIEPIESKYLIKENTGGFLANFKLGIKDKNISIFKMEYNKQQIIELTKGFCLTKITSFPLDIFVDLVNHWYKIKLSFAQITLKNIELKAAAEPQHYNFYKDNDDDSTLEPTGGCNISQTESILPTYNVRTGNWYTEQCVGVSGENYVPEILVN